MSVDTEKYSDFDGFFFMKWILRNFLVKNMNIITLIQQSHNYFFFEILGFSRLVLCENAELHLSC